MGTNRVAIVGRLAKDPTRRGDDDTAIVSSAKRPTAPAESTRTTLPALPSGRLTVGDEPVYFLI
jgi:hypothetical protein